MKKIIIAITIVIISLPIFAAERTGFGIHAGIGTDISLGLAFGGGASYVMMSGENLGLEFGIDLYYAHSTDTTTEGIYNYTYIDTSDVLFYAATFNSLINYNADKLGVFFILGTGAGAANINWKKSSPDDMTYNDSGEDTAGGLLVNLGVGGTFGNGLEVRLQAPIMVIFGYFGTTGVVPMLNLNLGYRF